MSYNPDIHHRKSIRLKEYDYSQEGLYFITICTQNREHLFGEIVDNNDVGAGFSRPNINQIHKTKIGKIIENEIINLPNKYKNIKCDEYVIMPNHIHFIIEIMENIKGREDPAPTIGNIVGYFKFITTKLYNEILEIKNEKYLKLWQRNYYENIIRNEKQYIMVSEYIKNNPLKWTDDKYYEK
jgi:REP element-mobilizing transposase RayT